MYTSFIWLGFLFHVCSSHMIVIVYKSPKISEALFNNLRVKRDPESVPFSKQFENENDAKTLCNEILTSIYFENRGIGSVEQDDLISRPESDFHLINDKVIVFPERQAEGVTMFHCCGQKRTHSPMIHDFFIANAYHQDVYFVLRKNLRGNIVPFGLAVREPEYADLSQNDLEKRYTKERSNYVGSLKSDSVSTGEYLDSLTKPEIYALVHVISNCTFFKKKKIEFRNGASHINYDFDDQSIRFETQLFEDEPKSQEESYFTEEERNQNIFSYETPAIGFLAYTGDLASWYFIGRSYDDNRSLYLFKQREDENVILFGYLYNVMVLNKNIDFISGSRL